MTSCNIVGGVRTNPSTGAMINTKRTAVGAWDAAGGSSKKARCTEDLFPGALPVRPLPILARSQHGMSSDNQYNSKATLTALLMGTNYSFPPVVPGLPGVESGDTCLSVMVVVLAGFFSVRFYY